jgi:uncharacterized membrane protein SpoIIM required for sporulation
MKEAAFLRANADKWKRFEALLHDSAPSDPDELARLFVELTDDLSYARTYYPGGKTEAYLNQLTATSHRKIYRNRGAEPGWFRRFWREDVPKAVGEARGALAVSAAIFVVAIGIGIVSSLGDHTFVRLIMGDAYVELTMQNIEAGDPMAIYKQSAKFDMFMGITLNNILVAFRAFVFGVLTPVATGYVLLVNGVMLGAFHTLFHSEGILWESLLVVYIHGALEIPAIIVAGAAGITMGSGFLFPGTYSRLHAFRRGAKRGLTIVLGLVPVFVVAGFLEGFVTRYTDMPVVLSLTIIAGSLGFVARYFIYIPLQFRHSDDV